MYWYRILSRDKTKELGRVAADSPKLAVEKWYKSGNSRYSIVVAEVYGLVAYGEKNTVIVRK
jgi:hypothetical protein